MGLNSGISEIEKKHCLLLWRIQRYVSYIFYPDDIVLLPHPKMGLGRQLILPTKDAQRCIVFADVLQNSVRLNLTILYNKFFSVNMEGDAYYEICPDTLSRASVTQLCDGADPEISAEED